MGSLLKSLDALVYSANPKTITKNLIEVLLQISQKLPFENKRKILRNPKMVKPLLLLYPFAKESINLILYALLDIFGCRLEWMTEVFQMIEQVAIITEIYEFSEEAQNQFQSIKTKDSLQKNYSLCILQELLIAKEYALIFLHQSVIKGLQLNMDLDERFQSYVQFLNHTENEGFILKIMNQLTIMKRDWYGKFKNMPLFDEKIENALIEKYGKRNEFDYEDKKYKLTQSQLSIKLLKNQQSRNISPRKTQTFHKFMIPSQTKILQVRKFSSSSEETSSDKSIGKDVRKDIEEFISEGRQSSYYFKDNILISQDPHFIDVFKYSDNLTILLNFITDPVLYLPITQQAQNLNLSEIPIKAFKIQVKNMILMQQLPSEHLIANGQLFSLHSYMIRSYQALKFVQQIQNYGMILQNIPDCQNFQNLVRNLSGYFQNQKSIGNLYHIAELFKFLLRYDLQSSIFYILSSNIMNYFLDCLYNDQIFDLCLSFLDPIAQIYQITPEYFKLFWDYLNEGFQVMINDIRKLFIDYLRQDCQFQGYKYLTPRISKKQERFLNTQIPSLTIPQKGHKQRSYIKSKLEQEFDNFQFIYILENKLGTLCPGKNLQQHRQEIQKSLKLQAGIRSFKNKTKIDIINLIKQEGLVKQIKNLILEENIKAFEFFENKLIDIDGLAKQVVEYNQVVRQGKQSLCQQSIFIRRSQTLRSQTQLDRFIKEVQSYDTKQDQDIASADLITKNSSNLFSQLDQNLTPHSKFQIKTQKTQVMSPYIPLLRLNRASYKQPSFQLDSLTSTLGSVYPDRSDFILHGLHLQETARQRLNNQQKDWDSVSHANSKFLEVLIDHACMTFHPLFMTLHPNSRSGVVLLNGLIGNDLVAIEQLLNYIIYKGEQEFDHKTLRGTSFLCVVILNNVLQNIGQIKGLLSRDRLINLLSSMFPKIAHLNMLLNKQSKKTDQLLKIQLNEVQNTLGTYRLQIVRLISFMIQDNKLRDYNVLHKLGNPAILVFDNMFRDHTNNNILQSTLCLIWKNLLFFGTSQQILSFMFKLNILNNIADSYLRVIINEVKLSHLNIDSFLFTIQYLSNLIQLCVEVQNQYISQNRDDCFNLKFQLQATISYQKVKIIASQEISLVKSSTIERCIIEFFENKKYYIKCDKPQTSRRFLLIEGQMSSPSSNYTTKYTDSLTSRKHTTLHLNTDQTQYFLSKKSK